MPDDARDDEQVRNHVTSNNQCADNGDPVRFQIRAAGFFTQRFSSDSPCSLAHYLDLRDLRCICHDVVVRNQRDRGIGGTDRWNTDLIASPD